MHKNSTSKNMKKSEQNKIESLKGIVIDGVELVSQQQAAIMAGVSLPTFRKKAKLFRIESVKRSNYQLYRKQDIETAITNNWFSRMWC